MGALSITHWAVVLMVGGFLLFGRGAVQGWINLGISTIKDIRKATKDVTEPVEQAHKEITAIHTMAEAELTSIKNNISQVG
jgi:Sec-independent protein translocase protein TatA